MNNHTVLSKFKKLYSIAKNRCGDSFFQRIVFHNPINGTINLLKIARSLSKDELPGNPSFYPPAIILEVTNRCNLKCNTCILGTDKAYNGYQKKDISFDEFKHILKQIPPLVHVWLQGVGEPLLNQELPRMVEYAYSKGITCSFNTNGLLLNEKIIRELTKVKLAELYISINTTDEALFKKTKSGASLLKIIDNVSNLVNIRNKLGEKHPVIGIRVILMQDTIGTAEILIKKAANLGVEKIGFQDYLTGFGNIDQDNQKIDDDTFKQIMDKLFLAGEKYNITVINDKTGTEKGSCTQPWFSPFITAEGYVAPCCDVFEPRSLNYGNIFEQDFREIWLHHEFVKLRGNFRKIKPSICYHCPLY
jgi:MoaA/NifB/PqqE/SkfB family radical SAM enzyme